MFSEFQQHSNYINIPYRLVRKYRETKAEWDLLCFAICLKLNSSDSGMYLNDPRDIMRLFHCSYRKARRLMLQSISDKDLFHYNPKTKFIVARSFKRGCGFTNSHSGKVFHKDNVIVIDKEADGTISHYKTSSRLRDLLIQKMLRTQSPSDELECQNNPHSESRKPLTQEYIGNVAGCHQTTVSRRTIRMAKNKQIAIKSHAKIPVWDLEHGIVLNDIPDRKPFIVGRFAYIRDVNEYTILDNSIHFRFKHIIYNHRKRKTDNKVAHFPWETH